MQRIRRRITQPYAKKRVAEIDAEIAWREGRVLALNRDRRENHDALERLYWRRSNLLLLAVPPPSTEGYDLPF